MEKNPLEKFDPRAKDKVTGELLYKKVEDLPEPVREFYADTPDGGFVRKTAKALYDRKKEELRKKGVVLNAFIRPKTNGHETEQGLGVSPGEYMKRLYARLDDLINISKEGRKNKDEQQEYEDIIAKIWQDEAGLPIDGEEFKKFRQDLDNAEAEIDDAAALKNLRQYQIVEKKREARENLLKQYREKAAKKQRDSWLKPGEDIRKQDANTKSALEEANKPSNQRRNPDNTPWHKR